MPRALVTSPRSFDDLVRAVRAALVQGQTLADRAYLATYHRTGQLLDAHLLANQKRAGYGSGLIRKLAPVLQTDERLLYRCLRFYRAYPILANRPELAWAHYRVLLDVADEPQREALEREARKKHWTSTELEDRVRALNALDVTPRPEGDPGAAPSPRLLTPKRGTPGVCKVIAVGETLVVDLGFATYLDLPPSTGLRAREGKARASSLTHDAGDFVRVTADGVEPVSDATKADLFTYAAEILKVVDGDTLGVKIYLRPGQWVKQKLRLRDLDCPEIATPEGKAAKRFTESLVPAGTSVTVCTTKPDKYDRYLADVFVASGGSEKHLNNELLAAGHAGLKRAWEYSDWNDHDTR